MLAGLDWSVSVLGRLWPISQVDELSQPKFIHDHASVDVASSLVLVDLEQRRALENLSQYFDAVRQREGASGHCAVPREICSPTSQISSTICKHFIPCRVSRTVSS